MRRDSFGRPKSSALLSNSGSGGGGKKGRQPGRSGAGEGEGRDRESGRRSRCNSGGAWAITRLRERVSRARRGASL
jgi:hypothetical protein